MSTKAWRITSALQAPGLPLWGVIVERAEAKDELQNHLVGLGGLVALAAGIAVEAGLVAKKALAGWLLVEIPLFMSGQSEEAK